MEFLRFENLEKRLIGDPRGEPLGESPGDRHEFKGDKFALRTRYYNIPLLFNCFECSKEYEDSMLSALDASFRYVFCLLTSLRNWRIDYDGLIYLYA